MKCGFFATGGGILLTVRGRGNPSNYPKIQKSPNLTITGENGTKRGVFSGNILAIEKDG